MNIGQQSAAIVQDMSLSAVRGICENETERPCVKQIGEPCAMHV